jgi:predicted SnoaL-like aldol condensation-catalyzing enzyme
MKDKNKKIADKVDNAFRPGSVRRGRSKIVMMYYKHTKHVDNGVPAVE